MNEKSHHLTDATQGDKQGRAAGGREGVGGRGKERGWQEEKKRVCVCVFSSATPF